MTALKERANAPQGLTLNRTELDWRAAMQSTQSPARPCSFEACDKPVRALGLCHGHHTQQSRGVELRPLREMHARIPIEDRMSARTDKDGDCWLWTGATRNSGYGHVRFEGRMQGAHRVAYELEYGPIPDGLVVDHLCRTPLCVRPSHLEAVTQRENVRRGVSPAAAAAVVTVCPSNHAYAGENLYVGPGGERRCRECARISRAKSAAKRVCGATYENEGVVE